MHELSIALAIVDAAAEEAERQGGGRVVAVHLRLGPLFGVVKEALLASYETAREGTAVAGSELRIEEVPVVAFCPACAEERPIASVLEMVCPVCGGPTPRVVRGRELEVFALEIVS